MSGSSMNRNDNTSASTDTAILLHQLHKEYYDKNQKNTFYKNSQKFDCAKEICARMNVIDLMNHSFWVIPNKNRFYFDYRIYKLYGNPENFNLVVDNILHMTKWCISEYNCFEIHLNLSSFTISAAERYKNLITLFCEMCTAQAVDYTSKLTTLTIYNIPTIFESISKILTPLIPPEIIPKIRLVSREDSIGPLTQLYLDSNKTYTQ